MINNYFVFGLGFLAQGLFSARLLVQWLLSEKAKKVVSPEIFWQLSIFASLLLMGYGILRKDLVIIGGQAVSYFVYIRNLKLKESWEKLPKAVQLLALIAPAFTFVFLLFNHNGYNISDLAHNPDITFILFSMGTMGQVILTFRFVYQWIYSEKRKVSVLPPLFWAISIIGAAIIISYAIIRRDPVLIIGQTFGVIIYSRNLILHYSAQRRNESIKNKDSQ
ncbi:lipid-A-disaccharide synthase N-terminal domain-containing protein [Marinilabilia sp.]|uniref:lipid-A-disaccharide synthase N-terminal domain-containing protein n=1 Tax=Marinilabilia sp. TaxID=2021252 RepID=UPI0025BDD2D6|nr:lipid-A-disaccharide synthase N-terminal domain-containing protein [Marinilabilia sp.]